MSEYSELPSLARKRLSEAERARVLEKLHRLETAAMFTPGWDALAADLARWTWQAKALGRPGRHDIPRISAALEACGIE